MQWQLTIAVLCLAWITGSDSCCQPDQYRGDYNMLLNGLVPMGETGKTGKVRANLTGSVQMNWETQNALDQCAGTVTIPVGENGEHTMDLPVNAQMGLLTDDSGTKLWLRGEVPMMGVSECKYVELIGGVPDGYKCLLNYYKKGSHYYTSATPNPMVQERYTVDSDCVPATQQIHINIPPVRVNMNMSATVSNVRLSTGDFNNSLPAGCELQTALQIPPLRKGGPVGVSAMMSMAMAGASGQQGGPSGQQGGPSGQQGGPSGQRGGASAQQGYRAEKRAIHHAVMEAMAKRSLEKMVQRRMAKRAETRRSLDAVVRNVRDAYNHLYQ